ncbi:hypothetical protein LN042_35835 [Kitasatospora sp. RB6PN24]|uniref:hypothetical protein n=1 Tax=Kitasatospora humi TaxID=2893891 RepID=UPI001E3E0E06|nr:hypothetical protein [Kitasatospora humi]MCC9312367.1 hypothetical protein [Kitasatospora humi]
MRWRRQPRSRFTDLVDRIEVPKPFHLERFCDSVARQRRRPLRLVPLQNAAGQDLPCGLWIGLPAVDLVFYEAGAAPILKTQIVLHEISHMLLDHGAPATDVPALPGLTADEELGLDTDRVLALLARNGYTDRQEADAEALATLLLERATRAGAGRPYGGSAEVLDRLDAAFGHPVRPQ